ncbi:MAG: sigma-70 family RNA polymerase sigma factor [Saprospiraceae bacterium]|jgi:RNA polymerase sigma factor (sigma-70 family)|nr:sigma-70 family RNA polymerase sigma factor [Saprospiraceae bacterium]
MMSESEIIAGLLIGDSRATTSFVDAYSAYIYNVSHRILQRNQESEEATQDTCIKIINKIGDYNRTSPFKAWIFTVAYRTAIDYKRKQKRNSDESVLMYQASSMNADGDLEQMEASRKIHQLLAHLSEEDGTLVQLYYLNEMSIKEIVDATGFSESNIKIKLFRARKEMAKHIDKYFDVT